MIMRFCALLCILLLPYAVHGQTAGEASVDIVIEADTLAPAGYAGRHEPTSESQLRAVAIVSGRNTDTLTFRWSIDGRVAGGRNTAVLDFTAPFADSFLVRVDVFDASGRIATAQQLVTVSEPELVFYTYDLLRGLSRSAINDGLVLTGEEIIVRAEPYFMRRDTFMNTHDARWYVDGTQVAEGVVDEQSLTLRRSDGTGTSDIRFVLENHRAFTQYVDGSFTIQF